MASLSFLLLLMLWQGSPSLLGFSWLAVGGCCVTMLRVWRHRKAVECPENLFAPWGSVRLGARGQVMQLAGSGLCLLLDFPATPASLFSVAVFLPWAPEPDYGVSCCACAERIGGQPWGFRAHNTQFALREPGGVCDPPFWLWANKYVAFLL